MVSDLTKPQLRKIITAAGTGPHAIRDRALVCLLAYTGVSVVAAVQFHAHHLSERHGVLKVINPGWYFEYENRRVGLEPGARRILDKAIALIGWADLFPGISARRARRIVARSFVAAGLPPQRSAARLQEAFFRLSEPRSPRQPTLLDDLDLPRFGEPESEPEVPAQRKSQAKSKKRSSGPCRPRKGGNHA